MNILELFRPITTFVFDVDGVLTDGTVLLLENGLQARQMNIKDGLALQMALRNDFRVVIISGGSSAPVMTRLQYLGLQEIHLGIKNKKEFLQDYMSRNSLTWSEVLYMGDDLPDMDVLREAGLSCCPADAVAEVRSLCSYISPFEGGKGCVRDVIEKVLRLHDRWNYHPEISSR
jgi:3-deoxy-D-manno-octulosonate 8-phosphate phosphatase (KDO 8-P phosphatase)